jgi:hypothetical protein
MHLPASLWQQAALILMSPMTPLYTREIMLVNRSQNRPHSVARLRELVVYKGAVRDEVFGRVRDAATALCYVLLRPSRLGRGLRDVAKIICRDMLMVTRFTKTEEWL